MKINIQNINQEIEVGDLIVDFENEILLLVKDVDGYYLWVNLTANTLNCGRFVSAKDALEYHKNYEYRIIKANNVSLQEIF